MGDPRMHNRLYRAGWKAYLANRTDDPSGDPTVDEYVAGLPTGDQLAAKIKSIWQDGFDDGAASAGQQR